MSRKFKPRILPSAPEPSVAPRLRETLFLCVGNSCRSQMAEGFARAYGADVLRPASAGTAPANIVQPLTLKVMADKNITLAGQFPKSVQALDLAKFDLLVNMAGKPLPTRDNLEVREWTVRDPMGLPESVYVDVRDQIEHEVMRLILELRRASRRAAGPSR